LRFFFLLFFITLSNFNVFSHEIAVINIDYILKNFDLYQNSINSIKLKNNDLKLNLEKSENELSELNNKIESSKLFLKEVELNKLIDIYNQKIFQYQNNMLEYNNKIENQTEINKKIIMEKINLISQNIAIKNKINLILNENSYYMANTDLDISNIVLEELNKMNIDLNN
tara:strand:+ start:132 stop:641 length:510 start_codon:yes stop_codon:yes gene_type:complete